MSRARTEKYERLLNILYIKIFKLILQECSELSSIESNAGVKAVCLKSVIDVKGVKQITRK